jgi:ubiquinone/menaquinone biosynthesis C-methylase UbiE
VRHRLRALLPRLHVLSALNERPGDTVVTIGAIDSVATLAERVAPDGDVLVVDESVDELERIRHETQVPNVSYLIGTLDILPLTDASVDEVLAKAVLRADAAAGHALNLHRRELERLFMDTGFASVSVADDRGRLAILARKP